MVREIDGVYYLGIDEFDDMTARQGEAHIDVVAKKLEG
jgi:hypothetical protein